MFGATNIVKNSNKEKYVYTGYGIAFDGKDYERLNLMISPYLMTMTMVEML